MSEDQKVALSDSDETRSIDPSDAIRERAYKISQSSGAGTPEQNWARAEREINDEK